MNITESHLGHASRTWEILDSGTLQDHHNGYLKLDCAQISIDTIKEPDKK